MKYSYTAGAKSLLIMPQENPLGNMDDIYLNSRGKNNQLNNSFIIGILNDSFPFLSDYGLG